MSSPVLGQPAAEDFRPAPPGYQDALVRAERAGKQIFFRLLLQRSAAAVLASEGIEDARIEGTVLMVDGIKLAVRFVGTIDGQPSSLYTVRFDGTEVGVLDREDPPRPLNPLELRQHKAKQAALESLSTRCEARYAALLSVPLEFIGGTEDIYLIPLPEENGQVALGGHVRVEVADDGETVLDLEALSEGCRTLPAPDPGAEGASIAVSHSLSKVPVASHVFLSFLQSRPLAIATEAGDWIVRTGKIHYLGGGRDAECCGERTPNVGAMGLPEVPQGWMPEPVSAGIAPDWLERLVVWQDSDDEERPWRDDERFAGHLAGGHPDILSVVLLPDQGDHPLELMRVRVIDHHPESDHYLGLLLDQPQFSSTLRKWDNVAFAFDSEIGRPLARSLDGNYRALAVPVLAQDGGPLAGLYSGVLHYRRAERGRYENEVAACIETLREVVDILPAEVTEADRYVAHYTLGRCLAETYETDQAIRHFEQALELRPEALDPHLALLAELSVKVHGQDPPGSDPWLDAAFIDLSDSIRERFGSHQHVAALFDDMFDPESIEAAAWLSDAEIERGKRVGFASFRWKQP